MEKNNEIENNDNPNQENNIRISNLNRIRNDSNLNESERSIYSNNLMIE